MSDKAADVSVELGTSPDGTKTAVVKDPASNRAWSGEGATPHDAAATNATRKFLSDRRAKEYVG